MLLTDTQLASLRHDASLTACASDCRMAFRSFTSARGFFGKHDPNYDKSFNAAVHRERLVRTSETLVSAMMQLVGFEFGHEVPTIALRSQTEAMAETDIERNYAAALRVLGCDFLIVKELAPSPVQLVPKEQAG